jgi:hypothetical protein
MIVLMIISSLLLVLVGLAIVRESIKSAAVGFQDDYGFHEGAEATGNGAQHAQ